MIPLLVHLRPWDVVAGAVFDVRVASGPSADTYSLGGFAAGWAAALTRRPLLSLDLMSLDLNGRTQLGRASFAVSLGQIPGFDFGKNLRWMGAQVTIYSARDQSWGNAAVEFVGMINSCTLDPDTLVLEVDATVQLLMDRPLLTLEFTGGGGATGDAGKKGTLKPAGFGVVEYIEPVWFDQTRWIGMIDGYGNTISIQALMEGADDRGAAVANYASYTALAAAIDSGAIPPGRWGSCIAEGMVGLGAPPEYPIGVNATFGSGLVGSMMKRMLLTHVPLAVGAVDTAAFDALDVIVPFAAHYWTKDQVSVQDRVEALAASANATPLVSFQNKVTVTRATTSASVATLDRSGQQTPRVIDWQSAPPLVPYWKIRARVARPATVLNFDQVLYEDTIEDKGLYNGTDVYRSGNIVWKSDKSSWLYINATPTAGNAPPNWPTTSNAYWQNMTPPAAASDLKYADGTTIEALKPQEAGANVTESRTASAITGQGSFATVNTAAYGSALLTGFGSLAPLSELFYGSSLFRESSGGSAATLANFKTILGIAASITGQGAFATTNTAAYGSGLLTGFGSLAPLSELFYGSSLLRESSGGATATLSNFKTILGIAASITGQGAFATTNTAAYGSGLLTGFGSLAPLSELYYGSALFKESSGGSTATLANFKTILGIAASITGQGALATKTLVANADLAAAAVTAAKLANVSSSNLFLDETLGDAEYWNTLTNWTRVNDPTAANSLKTRYYLLSAAGNGTTSQADCMGQHLTKIPCKPGEAIVLSGVAYRQVGFTGLIHFYVTWYKGDGTTVISTDTSVRATDYRTVAATTVGVQAMEGIIVPPTDAYFCTIFIRIVWSGTLANAAFGAFAAPGARLAVDGGITQADSFRLNYHLLREDGLTRLTDATIWTALGIAAAIAGQAAAATDGTIEASADVTKSVTGPAALVIRYNADGSLKSGETPKLANFYLVPAGAAAYTTGITWAVSVVSGTFSGTAPSISGSGTGVLSINSGLSSPEAILQVTATRLSRAYPPHTIKIEKETAATTGSGGSSFASTTTLNTPNSTTFITICSLTVTTASGSTSVALSAVDLILSPATTGGNGSWNVQLKWQRETSPGTWSDVAAAVDSPVDPSVVGGVSEDGAITCATSATSLSSSTSYNFRMVGRVSAGGTRDINIFGMASAQG